MKLENIFRGEKFMIATHGLFLLFNCLTIVAGTQVKKSDHVGLNQVSFGTLMQLIKCLEQSQYQTKKFFSIFTGTEKSLESLNNFA